MTILTSYILLKASPCTSCGILEMQISGKQHKSHTSSLCLPEALDKFSAEFILHLPPLYRGIIYGSICARKTCTKNQQSILWRIIFCWSRGVCRWQACELILSFKLQKILYLFTFYFNQIGHYPTFELTLSILALAECCMPKALISTITGQGTAQSHQFMYVTAKILNRIM